MKKIIKLDLKGNGAGMLQNILKLSLGLFLFFSVSVLSAQSKHDFVGNKNLKAGEAAIYVLKTEYQSAQSQPLVTPAVQSKAKARGLNEMFYPKAIHLIAEGDDTKTVVNSVANALVDRGYTLAEITNFINALLPKLS